MIQRIALDKERVLFVGSLTYLFLPSLLFIVSHSTTRSTGGLILPL
jgi:hypothetical protein